jgi:hypothetical protein
MISTVSVVGVDDSVSPEDLADISQKYPFVEWGINLCSNAAQRPAYPSDEWLEELLSQADRMRLRGILHDRWERDILRGILSIKEEKPRIWDALHRIQVDVRKGHNNLIDALQLIHHKEVILTTNTLDSKLGGLRVNAHPLFPKNKAFCYRGYCGYCISADDVELINIAETEYPFWVSVDGFRGDDGITMDLFKVEYFLDSTEDHVTNDSWFKALLETEAVKKRFSDHPGAK